MKYNKTLVLVPAILLGACGGSDEQTVSERTVPGSVVYAFPMDGQADVSPKTDLVLRFSHAITDDETTLREKIRLGSGGAAHDFTVEKIDGGKSLKLEPARALDHRTRYSVTFEQPLSAEGSRTIETPNAIGEPGIQFDTRGHFTPIANLANSDATFRVAWQVPDQASPFQAMNISAFRLAMTHPVHPDWERFGGTIELLGPDGQAVPSTLLVKGNRITVDPCVTAQPQDCGSKADVLDAGKTYTLKLTNLPSLTNGPDGERFSQEFSFQPRDTGPTVVLKQTAVDSGLLSATDPDAATKSILNGQIINGVTLNSVLQGVAGPSQQTGDLFAELAFAPAFRADEALPLRIPKGSVLTSTSLNVRIGGEVPILNAATNQLQTTGNIKVTLLSDASGYMSPNPFTDDLNAPRHITLFMDVSMNTEEAQPNASLSQDLLGVELRGIALVQDGVLTIDAIGMVEPNLLGQEFTDSTIAFHLQAATDVDSVLDAEMLRELDNTPPQLVSWMPGPANAVPETRQAMQRPGDPVVLNFDEPLDPASVPGGVIMLESGIQVTDLETRLDGTALAINPKGGLKHGAAYRVSASGLTDIAGNPAVFADLEFVMTSTGDEDAGVEKRSPIALTTYPGFPCATTAVDLNAGTHGQCLDAAPGGPAGDLLPIADMPTDRPIAVVFSQSMQVDTINSDTLVVEKISDASTTIGEGDIVSGRIEKNNQRIRFFPDQPWELGSFYRYTLRSSTAEGDCAAAICSELGGGLPLKTDLLINPETIGGPDMTIYFRGSEAITSVFTPLRNLPVRDTNSNFVIDCPTLGGEGCLEPFDHESDGMGGFLPSENSAKLLVENKQATVLGAPAGAAVGCAAGTPGDCPRDKFIYQTYGLNAEVAGPAIDPETNRKGVRILLYPTMLAATSATVVLDGLGDQVTGPQVLRMRYSEGTEGRRDGLIEGIIIEDDNGGPLFKTTAELTLDAPNLTVPLDGTLQHNLYSLPITLNLDGPITFFDDGRMQIEQRNKNAPDINVLVTTENALLDTTIDLANCLAGLLSGSTSECDALLDEDSADTGAVVIPLFIPEGGIYLNFISNPIKEIPVEQ